MPTEIAAFQRSHTTPESRAAAAQQNNNKIKGPGLASPGSLPTISIITQILTMFPPPRVAGQGDKMLERSSPDDSPPDGPPEWNTLKQIRVMFQIYSSVFQARLTSIFP